MTGTRSALLIGTWASALLFVVPTGVLPAQAAPERSFTPAQAPTFTATGFFHTAYSEGRWWLVTPDGQPFYSSGIDHVSDDPDTDQKTGQCPYCITIASKYPSTSSWAAAQVTRLRSWGFNTLGPFSDTSGSDGSVLDSSMPFTVLLNMASGDDWFSPAFAQNAEEIAAEQCAPLANDPNLVGYYLDSELHWGPDWREDQPVLDDYLSLPEGSPGRAVAEQYVGNPGGFLYALATRYFQVTTSAIRAADPNHLILGVKAVTQLTQPQLLEAAAPYVDVWSVDDYQLTPAFTQLIDDLWPFYLEGPDLLGKIEAIVGKPIIVSEYSFRSADSGLTNSWPPIYPTYQTQGERAAQYEAYVEGLYHDPFVVGDSWFEYVDEPYNGRFDGEDSNFGIVSTSDVPYTTMTQRMTVVHALAPGAGASPCVSWTASSTPVTGPADVECTTTAVSLDEPSPGPAAGGGYWTVDSAGDVFPHGDAANDGDLSGETLDAPVVGMAATPDGGGYWLAASDGGVFSFGDAPWLGSLAGRKLDAPVVAIASSPSGEGYWLVASDGGVFSFGDATFAGSLAGVALDAPVVGIASTPDGGGYWLVASDGGVFSFGDATFAGSAAPGGPTCSAAGTAPRLAPVVGIAPTADGGGYWLVDEYGNLAACGDAPAAVPEACTPDSCSSVAAVPPVVAICADPGGGFWLASADGAVSGAGEAAASTSPPESPAGSTSPSSGGSPEPLPAGSVIVGAAA